MSGPQPLGGAVTIYDGAGQIVAVLSMAAFRAQYDAPRARRRLDALRRARRAARLRWTRHGPKPS